MRAAMLAVVSVVLTYGLVEGVATTLYTRGYLEPRAIWMHERADSNGNLRFDAVSGMRLSGIPARVVDIATDGSIEASGRYHGNNHGFPDRDDFYPERRDPKTLRLAVFGDSFSAAQYFEKNWPDRAEDLARAGDRKLELLNFSLDAVGLMNWVSILTRLVQPQGYQLDGVVFAVFGDDLDRRFTWLDDSPRKHRGELQRVRIGRSRNWRLEETPTDTSDGHAYMRWYIVTPHQLDQALAGEWRPTTRRRLHPFLWMRAQRLIAKLSGGAAESSPPEPEAFHPGQRALIERTRQTLKEMGLPALVFRLPARVEDPSWEGDAERFAKLLGARFVDGGAAFEGLSESEFDALWLPVDGHWNQRGSDLFAKFALDALDDWP